MIYKLVTAVDKASLEAKVNALIQDGWICQGGISVAYCMGLVFCQAMLLVQR